VAARPATLYLRIQLAPHGTFERKGRDLYTRVAVPLTVAVLGGEVDVPALGGRTLRLKVPAGHAERPDLPPARTGHGAGRQSRRAQATFMPTVDVQLPRQVTTEQRDHFEALAKMGV
jgi:DnaJ-class molecular chaperone